MARRIDRLPDVVAVPITLAVLAGLTAFLVLQQAVTDSQRSVGQIVLMGSCIFWSQRVIRTERRLYGGKEQQRVLRRALRTGVVPAVADEDRWRAAASTWPRLDRLRGRRRWTIATMVVVLVPVYAWVAIDLPPQPSTLVLVALTLLPVAWVPISALELHRLDGVDVVRDHLLGTADRRPDQTAGGSRGPSAVHVDSAGAATEERA